MVFWSRSCTKTDMSSPVILGLIAALMDKRKKDAEDFILRVLHVSCMQHVIPVVIHVLDCRRVSNQLAAETISMLPEHAN